MTHTSRMEYPSDWAEADLPTKRRVVHLIMRPPPSSRGDVRELCSKFYLLRQRLPRHTGMQLEALGSFFDDVHGAAEDDDVHVPDNHVLRRNGTTVVNTSRLEDGVVYQWFGSKSEASIYGASPRGGWWSTASA